jgi:hypothetical protein
MPNPLQESGTEQDVQPQRVVVLGASNVTRSITSIYQTLTDQFAAPIELLAAFGHGRSYGLETSVLGRRLPSILDCGLWPTLAERGHRPTKVLLTDIGNDLIYNQSVETLFSWVCQCLDRLTQVDNELIVTQLPVANFENITPRTFKMMKMIFFPSCELELHEIMDRAGKFSKLFEKEIQSRSIRVVRPQATWYGWDPIHVRRRDWPEVWSQYLDFTSDPSHDEASGRLSLWQKLRMKFFAPEYRVLLGMKQRKVQPVATFRDGSTVSFF